ncbi:MAG: hypothetical protein ACOYOV_07240 [Bacteroidales bacterium]
MEKKHIIIVSVYFPPIISIASNRLLAFAKYLDPLKYRITVIALQSGDGKNRISLPNVEIIYVPNKQFFKRASFSRKYSYIIHKIRALWNTLLNVVDFNDFYSWENTVFLELQGLIKEPENTILISSYPTSSPLIIASRIKRKFSAIKWISDLRDGISNNSNKSSFFASKYKANIEETMMEQADVITAVSSPILKYLETNYKEKGMNFHEIRNGYDFEYGNNGKFNPVFTISYLGNFYGNRNPSIFYKALETILENGYIPKLEVHFIGVGGAVMIPHKLKKIVFVKEKVAYDVAIEYMRNSDALLLVLPKGENKGVFSGKIFDYLGVMRPIIPLVDTEDVAAELIRETNAGKLAEWNSVEEAIESILYTYHLWKQKTLPPYNSELIKSLHRKYQVEKLGKIIDGLWN